MWIRKFGRALNFDTGSHEKFHQEVVVKPFKADARREEGQLHRMYVATNVAQCVNGYLRVITTPPPPKPQGDTITALLPHSFKRELETKVSQSLKLNELKEHRRVLREVKAIKDSIERVIPTNLDLNMMSVGKKMVREFGTETLTYVCNDNYLKKEKRYYSI